MKTPFFIWSNPHGLGRNKFVLFRREFTLPRHGTAATLHLFADTRYRLRVNGEIAAYGPCRFIPSHPLFDSVNLLPYLQKGKNVITVEVNLKGAVSFEHHDHRGGFIAWGKAGTVDFSTPGEWACRELTDVDPNAPLFSFAQSAVEIRDLRKHRSEWHLPVSQSSGWKKPVPVTDPNAWGKLKERMSPPLGHSKILPQQILACGKLSEKESHYGFRIESDQPLQPKTGFAYATHLFSPVDQEITIGLFWGPHYLNGLQLHPSRNPLLGNREDYLVYLRKGWNFLYGEPGILAFPWCFLLGIPNEANVTLSANQKLDDDELFYRTPPLPQQDFPGHSGKIPSEWESVAQQFPWVTIHRDTPFHFPTREVAWKSLEHPITPLPRLGQPVSLSCDGNGSAMVFDMGREFLGHIRIDLEAPPGTLIDLSNDERLRSDGLLGLYASQWGINSTDRLIWPGGRQTVEAFHERGGRYVQVNLRGKRGSAILHQLSLRRSNLPLPVEGSFECSDPLFNWTWSTGVETQRASMTDGWIDPWRERGLYLGDALVEAEATRLFTRDRSLERFCWWLWSVDQCPNGQMLGMVPVDGERHSPSFTLLWILGIHNYWTTTGDLPFIKKIWPSVSRIFSSLAWQRGPHGLWDTSPRGIFIDWGIQKSSQVRNGENGVLNAFRVGALNAAADLAHAMGDDKTVSLYRRESSQVKKLFQILWLPDQQRYAAALIDGRLLTDESPHANVLALLFDLVPPSKKKPVLDYVLAGLEKNIECPPCYLELYFLYFALRMLAREKCPATAEQVIRDHYGLQQAGGAWTFWETFSRESVGGSHCHGWSAAPLIYFVETILGVRPLQPGKPDHLLIQPIPGSLQWARGRIPHPRGIIEVKWEIIRKKMHIEVKLPKGVKAKVITSPAI